jgi:adenylyltransferase/sulfurtransferase
MPHVGSIGISKLQSAKIAIVGVGGVGSAIAYYLSRSGIGYLRLIDQDIVLESNLQRLHNIERRDIFKPKAEAVAAKLGQDASCKIDPIVDTLTETNVEEILSNIDLVIDGLDNFRARYIVNEFSVKHKIPYLFTSSVDQQLHIALFLSENTGCLECRMPGISDRPQESCEYLGASAIATGLTGALAANIVVNRILHISTNLDGQMLTVDLGGPDFILSKLHKNKSCKTCREGVSIATSRIENVFMLCGSNTVNVLPEKTMNLDLGVFSKHLHGHEQVLRVSDSAIVYRDKGRTISLFRNGRILIEGVSEKEIALMIARQTWESIPPLPT